METAPLKSFATSARTELVREVGARITAVLAQGSPERVEQPKAVTALERAIAGAGGGEKGKARVADKVAYTWFNRIIALRFMDANGYTGIGVVSPAADQVGQPEVLAAAKRGQLDTDVVKGTNAATITGLLNGTRQPRPGVGAQAEAYALLLADHCRFWNTAMPFMFEREGDYTELLIPANLLADDSVLSRSVAVLTEEVCQDVEVIGWLYQFYIAERKDEVFAGFKKNKKAGADEIPAATQLFTPHWIVRYLVENSLGRLWMLNHPTSGLASLMDYYIAPVDEETGFLKITRPEDLKVIDPACGSGHMLTYAFDLLYAIYEEEGYSPAEIPGLILTHNLHGTEIDGRAGALAAFALTMKARSRQRTFFNKQVEPNVCVIEPISFTPDELDYLVTKDGDRSAEERFWNQFAEADTLGALIQPDPGLTVRLARHVETLDDGGDMLRADSLDWARLAIRQAEYLSPGYAVVVANPPYMGSKQMNDLLSQFMKDEYLNSKSDLFAAFIERVIDLVKPYGYMAQVTMQSWMFLSSYEKLRSRLQREASIVAMLHMDNMVMKIAFGTSATIWQVGGDPRLAGKYTWITIDDLDRDVPRKFPAKNDRNSNAGPDGYFTVAQSEMTAIPGSPVVYWLSEKMRGSFSMGKPLSEVANLRQGLATADNNRFLRQWWEVSGSRMAFTCTSREEAVASGARWFPYNKGGEFRKWYGNQEHVVNWEHDGVEIRVFGTERGGRPRSRAQNTDTYFSPSVSWSDISSGEAAFRRFPAGFIHDVKGMSAFGDPNLLDRVAVLMNSSFARAVLAAIAPTLNFQVGDVGKVPVMSDLTGLPENTDILAMTARDDWDCFETSWKFEGNPLAEIAAHG